MKTDIESIPNLYSITGNVLDINTVLINREELRKLIAELRDLVTTEGETKADFVARVRAVLGEDPDARVARVAAAAYAKGQEDMRERCAKVCMRQQSVLKTRQRYASAIRALPITQKEGEA